jgi:formate C-acetyltransferase
VRSFIKQQARAYTGNGDFLQGPTLRTKKLWQQVLALKKLEQERGGVLAVEENIIAGITAFPEGYIDRQLEIIKGLQTSAPLKRALKPYGGIKTVRQALAQRGLSLNPQIEEIFTKYRKTHNQGVYDAYTRRMRSLRKAGVLTGLPDNYGRGRIIGDYRRVALFGVDRLISAKKADQHECE